jgi:hypothetical protein
MRLGEGIAAMLAELFGLDFASVVFGADGIRIPRGAGDAPAITGWTS